MNHLPLPFEPARYVFVLCTDQRGNEWRHKTSDPEGTRKQIEADMPDVKVSIKPT